MGQKDRSFLKTGAHLRTLFLTTYLTSGLPVFSTFLNILTPGVR